jgi:hypothetical protein
MTQNQTETTELAIPELETSLEVLTETEIRRCKMREVVRQYLTNQEWRCDERERQDGGMSFICQFNMKNGNLRVFMDAFGDGDRFAVYCYSPVMIPEEYREAVAIYTVLVNNGIVLGKLEMDMEDGEVRMSTAVDVAGSELSLEMISVMENITIIAMDNHLASVLKIVYGGCTPQEALAAHEASR